MKTIRLPHADVVLLIVCIILISDLVILLDVPFLRQIFGLAFVLCPGALIISILRLSETNRIERALFSVGVSVSCVMFLGFFMNFALPFVFGVSPPLSLINLVIVFTAFNLILAFIAYRRGSLNLEIHVDRVYKKMRHTNQIALVVVLIPVTAILGALVTQFYSNTLITLLSYFLIASLVSIVALKRDFPKEFFPLILIAVALALQFSRILTTPYLFGADIHYEYFYQQQVQTSGFWDLASSGADKLYGMLSVTILPAILAILLKLDGILIYKLVFSIILALLPVGLFQLYRTQIGDKLAFFSAFFFISSFTYFIVLAALPRQYIAEFLIILSLILIINPPIRKSSTASSIRKSSTESALVLLFLASTVVSHYGVTVLFLLILVPVVTISFARRQQSPFLSYKLMLLLVCFVFFWYFFMTPDAFGSIIGIIQHSARSVPSTTNADPLVQAAIGTHISVIHYVGSYWIIFAQFFIVAGVLLAALRVGAKKTRYNSTFFAGAIISLFLLAICVIVPAFAKSLNLNRIYGFLLIFLAPFCVTGIVQLSTLFKRLSHKPSASMNLLKPVAVAIILIPYFLFNTGFIYELAEKPSNFGIDYGQQENGSANNIKPDFSNFMLLPVASQNVYAIKWLSGPTSQYTTTWLLGNKSYPVIYADEARIPEPVGYGPIQEQAVQELNTSHLLDNAYIYLGFENIYAGKLYLSNGSIYDLSALTSSVRVAGKIYTNGGSEVLRTVS